MITAKELREKLSTTLSEEVNNYLKEYVETKAIFASKCGKTKYSFTITDNYDNTYLYALTKTLVELGYSTSYTQVSPKHYEITINW
jgi:hypothetical protein